MLCLARRPWLTTIWGASWMLLAAHVVNADNDAERLAEKLTGGDERAWVKTRWEKVLAVEEARCIQGETWIFKLDGRGRSRVCQNGIVAEAPMSWATAGVADGQQVLELDGTRYIVDLRQRPSPLEGEPPVLVAILRTLRTSQDEPIEEIWLEFRPR